MLEPKDALAPEDEEPNRGRDEIIARRRRLGLPDVDPPELIEKCRLESVAIAAHDPAGDEVMKWIEELYEWPEP